MNPLYRIVYRHFKVVWLAGLLKPASLLTEEQFFAKMACDPDFKARVVLLKNEFKYLIKAHNKLIVKALEHKMPFGVNIEEILNSLPAITPDQTPEKGDCGYNSKGEYGVITEDPVMADEGLTWKGIRLKEKVGDPWQSKNPIITGHIDL